MSTGSGPARGVGPVAELPSWPVIYFWALLHLLVLVTLVYGLFPLWALRVFRLPTGTGLAGVLARSVWAFFVIGLLIHGLVVLRVFEGLVLLLGLALILLYWSQTRDLSALVLSVARWLSVPRALSWRSIWQALWGSVRSLPGRQSGLVALLPVLVPLAVSGWLRFADALGRVSPAMADAEVTIKWMRLVENSYSSINLYPDGVYPMGMYTFLALLRKLSHMNPIPLLQVTGPMVGFGLVLGGAAALYMLTRRPLAAAVYAWLYGTMATWLPINIERHAAHNSQEFGMLFMLPAVAFAMQYILEGQRWQALAAAAALGMTVLVNPQVAGLYTGLALAISAFLVALDRWVGWRRLLALAGWSAAGGVLGALPPVMGLLLGLEWHGSSLEYATAAISPTTVPGPGLLMLLIPAAALLSGAVVWWWPGQGRGSGNRSVAAAALGLGASALLAVALTWSPAYGVPLRFLYDRGRDPTAMLVAAAGGSLWALLTIPLAHYRRWRWLPATLILAAMPAAWWLFPPEVPRPYRVFNDATLYQYLRIDAASEPGTWAMVAGPDGYTLALGRAFHIYPGELDQRYQYGPDGLIDLTFPRPPS